MFQQASLWLIPVANCHSHVNNYPYCINLFKIPLSWGTPPLNKAIVANPVWRELRAIVTQTASEFNATER